MAIISLPVVSMGPFGMPMLPGTGPGGGGGGGGGGGSNALTDGWTVKSTFSGMSNERFYSIGDDSSNNFYAAGYDAVDDTILVASYDKDGNYRWSYNAGGTSDRLYDTAVDTNGNMVAVGYSMSTTGGSTPFPALIVKYTSAGSLVWSRALNDSSSENWLALAVTTDSSDNIYIAGRTQAQSNGNNDLPFVAKLNNAGAVQWVKKYDHGGQQSQPEGIALDSNGDIIVSGRIHEQITGGGYSAGMVFKASGTDGSIIWNKFFDDGEPVNGYHNDQFQNVAITPEDDILTCGWTNKDYAGTYYGAVIKLSGTDGSIVWQRHTNEEDGTKKIAVDSAGKIYTFTDSEVLFVYASDGTLEQEWKITASGSGADAYYLEDVYIDKNDNAVLCGFFYTGGGDPAFPFITKLPATIQAGTTGDFVITAQSKGDSAGGLTPTTFTSYTANTMSGVITNGTSGLTPSSVSATNTGPSTVTGVSGGGGGSQPQGWIATISDELNGNGYTDVQLRSLAVDSSDNIYAGGDATYYQLVVKMASDGTVTSAASFGASATTNNHRAITVASDESVYTAGEAKDMWGKKDGHVMRLTTALTKSYDDFFGEGYNDEHFDITSDNSGNIFAVGESQSFALNFSSDPKGHLVKYNNTGGQAKTLITSSQNRSYPQGISSDGTNVYVIAKDQSHMFIAKVNNALNSVTWSKSWGSSSAEPRIMDIDTNSSGESVALMYEGNKIRVAKIDSSGNATWRKTWEKASTDHGDAYPGYNFSAGYAVKLLSNGSMAMLAGYMPWTTQANKKSVYIIIFDSTGTPTVEKEFRLNNASHYLGQVTKSLVELSDGKIVTAVPYYTGSAWKNGIFKFDPTDTSTAINGTHGDWDISDISDSTTGADGTAYSNGSVFLDTNMSMYFKTGYQGGTNGFPVSSATVVEDTKQTLGGGGGGGGGQPVYGYGSAFFDGQNDYIETPSSLDFTMGTGDFTVECWFKPGFDTSVDNTYHAYLWEIGNQRVYITIDDGTLYLANAFIGAIANQSIGNIQGEWHHVAVTKESNVYRLFYDGQLAGSGSDSNEITGPTGNEDLIFRIANHTYNTTGTYYYTGHVSNMRVIKGTALYTSNFTVPTTPLSKVTNTVLLTCQDTTGTITDNSDSNHTLNIIGDTVATTNSPFVHPNYTQRGSTYFDGGEDYLKFPSSSTSNDLIIGTNDFTLEFWIYAKSFTNGGVIYDTRENVASGLMINFNTSGNLRVYANSGYRITADGVPLENWQHYAIVRDSGTTRLFLNGVQDTETYSDTNNYTGDTVFIGRHQSGVNVADFDGYISNLRMVVGTAVYTGNFTVPTAPLTDITNTKLLTAQNSSGAITDESSIGHSVHVNSNAQASSLHPFKATGSTNGSYYFSSLNAWNGTNARVITADSNDFNLPDGTDVTIEFWYKIPVTPPTAGNGYLFDLGDGNYGWLAAYAWNQNGTHTLRVGTYFGAIWLADEDLVGMRQNQWYHLAITRESGVWKVYLDGVFQGSKVSSTLGSFDTYPDRISLGGYHNMSYPNYGVVSYISDFRFVKGLAVYTGNFTPPSGPLTTTGGTYPSTANITNPTSAQTLLLTAQNSSGSFVDNSQYSRSLTSYNTVTTEAGVPN